MLNSELFEKCLKVVLDNEGGYSNHPSDPGGATNFGVIQKVYNTYRKRKGLEQRDVWDIEYSEVYEIYLEDYWGPMNLEELTNENLILHVFDHGVNAGIRISIKMLQKILDVSVDGFIGDETATASENYKGNIVEAFKKRRKLFYCTLADRKPTLKVFLKGWISRVDKTTFKN
jgi:lysozyme family protein